MVSAPMSVYKRAIRLMTEENMEALKKLLNEEDLVDLVQLMNDLDPELRVICFRLLNKDLALEVFERLDLEMQENLIISFAETEASDTFKNLAPDDRVRLLDELPARVAKKLLSQLDREKRAETSELLGYETGTAGRIMSPEYIRLRQGTKVSEAIDKLRTLKESRENIYNIYVTDNTRILQGVLALDDLVLADPDEKVENLMKEDPIKVTTDQDREDVARLLHEQDKFNLPVVDKENRLVGVVTADDAAEIMEEETTEDIFEMAGVKSLKADEAVRSRTMIEGSLVEIWKVRIPFLLIALAGGMMAGVVIDGFEETLEAIAAVAVFIPVIMDMGGNVGTQSSTIFARGLVLGQINVRRFFNYFLKELSVGVTMGSILGVLAGIIAHFWQGIPRFGLTVGIALALTVTIASSLGFVIPYILYKLDFDQAAGSDPIITTLKDITGLIIYFSLVQLFMSQMLM